MKNKLILKILACAMAGISVFTFAGCKSRKNKEEGDTPPVAEGPDEIGGDNGNTDNGNTDNGNTNNSNTNNSNTNNGNTDNGNTDNSNTDNGNTDNSNTDNGSTDDGNANTGSGSYQDHEQPNIKNNPVTGAVEIITAKGDLEAAYVTWKIDADAKWYNVYVKASTDANYTTKLDDPLVRKYSTYFRADAVGLKEGTYDFKVVPVDATTDEEASDYASEATDVYVDKHMRVGFAFVNGTSSGAYNEDGTLKSDARVIYVTEKTKNNVELEVTGAETNPCVGLQAILTGYGKKKDNRPLAVRLVGNVTDLADMLDGDIVIENKNNAAAGTTFEGIGNDATANGWGLRVKNSSNVEVRNLGFMNCDSKEGDDIGLQQGDDHVWVHNCDLFYGHAGGDKDQVKGDGALDTKKSSFITHSFNHFWDSGKCNLQGNTDELTSNSITYHHNWYDHSDSRHPRIRVATVHVFNNYYDGNAKYGVGATSGASVFVENNYFRSTAPLRPMMSAMQGTDLADGLANGNKKGTFGGEDGAMIKSFGNKYDVPSQSNLKLKLYDKDTNPVEFDCFEAETRNQVVPDSVKTKQGGTTYNNFDTATNMYEYEVETPDQAKATVQKFAGRIDGGDFKYTFDYEKEDGNSDVIPELKASVTNYKGGLLEVGGVGDVTSGSTGGSGDTGSGDTGSGDSGNTPSTPPAVEGQVTSSFLDGKPSDTTGVFTVGSGTTAKSGTVKIAGVEYKTGIKLDSNGELIVTVDRDCTLTLYLINGKALKLDNNATAAPTSSSEADTTAYVITLQLSAGTHSIKKGGDGENSVYYAILSPKS